MVLRNKVTLLDIYGAEQQQSVLREDIIERDVKPYVTKRVWLYRDLQDLGFTYG